jgi:putative esterase
VWSAQSFTSDQYSQIQVTSTQLTGNQWIGPAVRAQNSGQNLYAGVYFWNGGSPELKLFKRISGTWTELGSPYSIGALAAGTQLKLTVVGNSLAFSVNGVDRITAADTSLTGGAPGIMANGTASAQDWAGGGAGFQVTYQSTDSSGIKYYDILSDNNGYGVQTLRVLQPTNPAAGVAHNFLFVLPVEAGLGNNYGDGLKTVQALDAQDQYNLTVVEPTFANESWYANNPNDPNLQYETFMTNELVPWVDANLSITGTEQNWLIGFSKSGIGGQDLILKHPNLFALAASWDFPADMSSYNQYGSSPAANYGTEANFAANYQLTGPFVAAHAAPFQSENRIWLGGYSLYATDVSDYEALLTSHGVDYTAGPWQNVAHNWTSGWVPAALAALHQDSLNLPAAP